MSLRVLVIEDSRVAQMCIQNQLNKIKTPSISYTCVRNTEDAEIELISSIYHVIMLDNSFPPSKREAPLENEGLRFFLKHSEIPTISISSSPNQKFEEFEEQNNVKFLCIMGKPTNEQKLREIFTDFVARHKRISM